MLSDSVLFELSQSIHAERLANAERQRFASTRAHESSAVRATPDGVDSTGALRTFAARAARLLYQPGRVPAGGK
jgi:hypothetical protein